MEENSLQGGGFWGIPPPHPRFSAIAEGHASAAMTLDGYGDLFDHDLDGVADALDQARRKSGVSTSLARDDSENGETPELR